MAIRPVEFNGMVQRTHDISTLKQNEENKPILQQQNIQTKIQKDTMHNLQHVKEGEDAQQHETKYDAKEKGNNEYDDPGRKKKSRENKKTQGKIVEKMAYSSFDIKI